MPRVIEIGKDIPSAEATVFKRTVEFANNGRVYDIGDFVKVRVTDKHPDNSNLKYAGFNSGGKHFNVPQTKSSGVWEGEFLAGCLSGNKDVLTLENGDATITKNRLWDTAEGYPEFSLDMRPSVFGNKKVLDADSRFVIDVKYTKPRSTVETEQTDYKYKLTSCSMQTEWQHISQFKAKSSSSNPTHMPIFWNGLDGGLIRVDVKDIVPKIISSKYSNEELSEFHVNKLEFYVKTGDIKNAQTDDPIWIHLSDEYRTKMDTPNHNDFEQGKDRWYDLPVKRTGLDFISQIDRIMIKKYSSNGWCIEEFKLKVNGELVYEHVFSPPCHWLDNEPSKNRKNYWAISDDTIRDGTARAGTSGPLRNSPNWQEPGPELSARMPVKAFKIPSSNILEEDWNKKAKQHNYILRVSERDNQKLGTFGIQFKDADLQPDKVSKFVLGLTKDIIELTADTFVPGYTQATYYLCKVQSYENLFGVSITGDRCVITDFMENLKKKGVTVIAFTAEDPRPIPIYLKADPKSAGKWFGNYEIPYAAMPGEGNEKIIFIYNWGKMAVAYDKP